ncbi:spore germination gerab [Lucifera butyrica]|uniref:Spore germination gerab n=1 Tax=Lucifera butyrica TaxID=1351585 RepID=A0A498R5K9_9FIRM|nr:GerAB/ArcD/ProY family transporter [Lucifera butyrica]VBB06395.1 spore germination gerab [Lucifera butyrica]
MPNLEAKGKMSAGELTVILVGSMIGTNILANAQKLVVDAGQDAWISILLSGPVFYATAWMMVRLGRYYPDQTFAEYVSLLWGRFFGWGVLLWLALFIGIDFSLALKMFSRTIAFFLFDRTPEEVLALSMLAVCVYCTLQDLGTFIRTVQLMVTVSVVMLMSVWSLTIFSFLPENLLPLWPLHLAGIAKGIGDSWSLYTGYEVLLLLLPQVYRGKVSLNKAVGASFGCGGVVFLFIMVMTIGVLSVEGVKNNPFAVLTVIRSVELPGTFIERLENYLLLAWIPLVFVTFSTYLLLLSYLLQYRLGYADHRPGVLVLAPLIFVGTVLLDGQNMISWAEKAGTGLGLVFSFLIIPVSLYLAYRRQKRQMVPS